MASMDDWINQMIIDMGIKDNKDNKQKGGEVSLSDDDIDKVADRVISKLSEEDVSTSKPKNDEPKNGEPNSDKPKPNKDGDIPLD